MVDKVACKSCGAKILPDTAERTGGICARCDRLGPPVPSRIVVQARETPARCLSGFRVNLDPTLAAAGWDALDVARFYLACQCGHASLHILGHNAISESYPDTPIFIAPIAFECQECQRRTQLFDPRRDGYDAEIEEGGASSSGMIGTGTPEPFVCPSCGHRDFLPRVSLSYQFDDEEMDESDDLASRLQDFFDWFALSAECSKCGVSSDVSDYECA